MPTISSVERVHQTSVERPSAAQWSRIGINAVAGASISRRQGNDAAKDARRHARAEGKAAFPFGDHDYATD